MMLHKVILLFACWILSIQMIEAQEKIDSKQVVPFDELNEMVFGELNNSNHSIDILLDRTFQTSKLKQLNGDKKAEEINYEDWLAIFAELQVAHMQSTERPEVFDLYMQIQSHYLKNVKDEQVRVPFGILNYQYHRIKDQAIEKGLLVVKNEMTLSYPPVLRRSPFDKAQLFAACPLIDTIYQAEVIFDFNEFAFSNLKESARQMSVDFGDGRGWQRINRNQEYLIRYTSNGLKKVKTKIRYRSGWKYSYSTLYVAQPKLQSRQKSNCFSSFLQNDGRQTFTATGIGGNTISARTMLWLGCGNADLRKPVILVTGHNLTEMLPLEAFYIKFNERCLLKDLRDQGYDIIIVKFMNGVDFSENNARLLRQVINTVNTRKFQNGSGHENTLIGYSAGNLAIRLALTQMERDHLQSVANPHHHSRLFVSYDGEHQGSNIPLGAQHAIESLSNVSLVPLGSLLLSLQYRRLLGAPMAREFLIYHHTQTGNLFNPGQGEDPLRTQLMQNFDNLTHAQINVNGYPAFTRNVGIADGSSAALNLLLIDQNRVLLEIDNSINLGIWAYENNFIYRSIAQNQNTVVMQRNTRVRPLFAPNFITIANEAFITDNTARPVDNAPGSSSGMHNNVKMVCKVLLLSFSPDIEVNADDCLVPTLSALDIRNHFANDYNYNVQNNNLLFVTPNTAGIASGYPHLQFPNNHYQITPFDAIYNSPDNEAHIVEQTQENADFIREEIAPVDLFLQNRNIGANTNTYAADFEAEQNIRAGSTVTFTTPQNNFVIEPNATVTFEAGSMIVLEAGFVARAGSRFSATLENCCCGQ